MRKIIVLIGLLMTNVILHAASVAPRSTEFEGVDESQEVRTSWGYDDSNSAFSDIEYAEKQEAQGKQWEPLTVEITMPQAGKLRELLWDDMDKVTTLVVKGPINSEDFYMMWRTTFKRLDVIDLEQAKPVGDSIPANAFFHGDFQYKLRPSGSGIIGVSLSKLILPKELKTIGDSAFCHLLLDTIAIPESVRKLGAYSFFDFRGKFDPLVLPEGITEIPEGCFKGICFLWTVKLPSTVKKIGPYAFSETGLRHIELNDGLKTICTGAFKGISLREIVIPETCTEFEGASQFDGCIWMHSASLPDGVTRIPNGFFKDCVRMTEVEIPATVEEIGARAFEHCGTLAKIPLPEGLREIGASSLYHCHSVDTLVIPSTLERMGKGCCQWLNELKCIYSKALVPPAYHDPEDSNSLFYPVHLDLATLPLYVPMGTKDLYSAAPGWSCFRNIIETDEFPSTSEAVIEIDDADADHNWYDLMGRKVDNPAPGHIYIHDGQKVLFR